MIRYRFARAGGLVIRLLHRPVRLLAAILGAGALLTVGLAAALLAPAAQAAIPQVATSPPTISGPVEAGQTLTEGHGGWSFTPTFFQYQWEQCDASGQNCTAIAGATGQTYQVASSDLGHTLRVQETALSFLFRGLALSAVTSLVTEPSVTSLLSVEPSAVTNQSVILVATVTSGSIAALPSGAVTFANHGVPIAGCQSKPVLPIGQSATVFCQTSFAAATQQLTATFTPALGSLVAGSASSAEALSVAREATTTALSVSKKVVPLRRLVTYTATVTPSDSGPVQPSGAVEFMDQGQPISACASRPVAWTGAAASASCTLTFLQPGQHLISARFTGDGNFAGSDTASSKLVDAVAGRIYPMLSWTVFYSPVYTKVLHMALAHVPAGASVTLWCVGRGCPFASRSAAVRRVGFAPGSVDLTAMLGGHRLKPGTVIMVLVERPGWIGKRYTFRIRRAHPPSVGITCQAPGLSPGVGC